MLEANNVSAAMHNFKLVIWIVAILYFSKCSEGFRISQPYSVVDKLGSSCPTSDSCVHHWRTSSTPSAPPNNYTCTCDHQCSKYKDCCIDGPRHVGVKQQMKCLEVKDLGGVYMIDSCPSDYRRSEMARQLCDLISLGYQGDSLAAMPVTDTSTGITYKNHYCSVCNENSGSLDRWSPEMECPDQSHFKSYEGDKDHIERGLSFQHVFWQELVEQDTSPFFQGCRVDPALPSHLHDKIRRCTPNLVSDCPTSWKDEDVRSMCRSYAGARFDLQAERQGYKNVHCAICNGADVTQLSCLLPKGTDTFRYPGNSSFAQLQDLKKVMKQWLSTTIKSSNYSLDEKKREVSYLKILSPTIKPFFMA